MGKNWPALLVGVGVFLGFFGAYLIIFRGPAANQAQLVFRLGLAVLGTILCLVGVVSKKPTS